MDSRIKAITFDLDNTLIDFMQMKRKASNAAAKAMVKTGLNVSVVKAEDELFKIYIKDIEGHGAFENFLEKHNAYSDRRLAAAINAYYKTKLQYMKPYPKVKSTLISLKKKGLKLAVITDAPKFNAWKRLDALGIADLFDVVVGWEDTRKKKPSALPFKKALNTLKFKPGEVLHVGDWPERDIVGAKKLGMKTCLAKYGYDTGKFVKPDYEINRFEDLLKLLARL
jgi:HAD superfamily hydrolase (TIGR02253 family)